MLDFLPKPLWSTRGEKFPPYKSGGGSNENDRLTFCSIKINARGLFFSFFLSSSFFVAPLVSAAVAEKRFMNKDTSPPLVFMSGAIRERSDPALTCSCRGCCSRRQKTTAVKNIIY